MILFGISKLPLWKKLTPKQRRLRIFIMGLIIYLILGAGVFKFHSLLVSSDIKRYTKLLPIITLIDAAYTWKTLSITTKPLKNPVMPIMSTVITPIKEEEDDIPVYQRKSDQ